MISENYSLITPLSHPTLNYLLTKNRIKIDQICTKRKQTNKIADILSIAMYSTLPTITWTLCDGKCYSTKYTTHYQVKNRLKIGSCVIQLKSEMGWIVFFSLEKDWSMKWDKHFIGFELNPFKGSLISKSKWFLAIKNLISHFWP